MTSRYHSIVYLCLAYLFAGGIALSLAMAIIVIKDLLLSAVWLASGGIYIIAVYRSLHTWRVARFLEKLPPND
jgi:membrane protein implicated in regulation of membrane protease activity